MSSVQSIALSCAGGAAGIAAIELLRGSTGLRLIAFDSDPRSYVQEIADEFHILNVGLEEATYGRRLLESVIEAGAGVLLPFHSGELGHIDSLRDEFAEWQVKWPAPLLGAATVLRDKLRLYEELERSEVPVPAFAPCSERRAFPADRVVFKLREGGGSRGLAFGAPGRPVPVDVLSDGPNGYLEQVAVDGTEVSMDGVVLTSGEVVGPIARVRVAVRGGLAIVSETVDLGLEGDELFRAVAGTCGVRGPLNVQAFLSGGEFVGVTDVNPRFPAGGMPLAARLGLNMPLIVVRDLLGESEVERPIPGPFRRLRHYKKWCDVFTEVQ